MGVARAGYDLAEEGLLSSVSVAWLYHTHDLTLTIASTVYSIGLGSTR